MSDFKQLSRSVKGLTVVVTGAASGMGRATARVFAAEGANVAVTDVTEQGAKAVADDIVARGGSARAWALDVADADAVHSVVDDVAKHFGGLDIVVNNAGMNIPDRSWRDLKPEGAEAVVTGNLLSAFYVAQAALGIMRPQKDGLMIHTASWAGRFIGPVSGPAYTAAKHGMVAMSHSINMEEGENGIRSCVICPGEVATPIMLKRPVPESPETLARMVQPGTWAT